LDAWLQECDDKVEKEGSKYFATKARDDINKTLDDLDTENISTVDTLALKKKVFEALSPGQTVASALRGLARKKKESKSTEAARMFDDLTEDAHTLLSSGYFNVYNDTREKMAAEIKRQEKQKEGLYEHSRLEENSNETSTSSNAPSWEYRTGDEIYGPFSTQQIKQWREEGYFTGESAVEMRQVQPNKTEKENPFVLSDRIDFENA